MIHPQYYVADCIRRLGKIIAHDASDTNINFPPHDVNEFRKTFMETNATGTGLISSEFDMFSAVKKYMEFVRRMDVVFAFIGSKGVLLILSGSESLSNKEIVSTR